MKTFLIIALIIGVAAVFINDVGHFARSKYDLNTATETVVDELVRSKRMTRHEAAIKAAKLGQQEGVEVYQYDQDDAGIKVWTRVPVDGTLVLGPFKAWRADQPLDTPFWVYDYGSGVYQ